MDIFAHWHTILPVTCIWTSFNLSVLIDADQLYIYEPLETWQTNLPAIWTRFYLSIFIAAYQLYIYGPLETW
jgi:hypothetical protein